MADNVARDLPEPEPPRKGPPPQPELPEAWVRQPAPTATNPKMGDALKGCLIAVMVTGAIITGLVIALVLLLLSTCFGLFR